MAIDDGQEISSPMISAAYLRQLLQEQPTPLSPSVPPSSSNELPSIELLHLDDSQPARPRTRQTPTPAPTPVPPIQSRLSLPSVVPPPSSQGVRLVKAVVEERKVPGDVFGGEKIRNIREGSRKARRKEQLTELLRNAKITKQDTLITFSNSSSPFSTLIHDRDARRKWRGFNSAPEEVQDAFIEGASSKYRNYQKLSSASSSDCFRRINQSVRKMLRKSNLPLDRLAQIEDQILMFLMKEEEYDLCDFEAEAFPMEEDDFDFCGLEAPKARNVKLTLHLEDAFLRLLAHGISQYYDLNSISVDADGERVTVITRKASTSDFPACRLTDHLKSQRAVSA